MRAAVLVAMLLVPSAARADGFGAALGGYVGTSYIDSAVTAWCSGAGTCREVGPALAPVAGRIGIVPALAIKGAATGAVVWGLVELRRDHPTAAKWIAIGLAVGQASVDVWNIRQLRRTR